MGPGPISPGPISCGRGPFAITSATFRRDLFHVAVSRSCYCRLPSTDCIHVRDIVVVGARCFGRSRDIREGVGQFPDVVLVGNEILKGKLPPWLYFYRIILPSLLDFGILFTV